MRARPPGPAAPRASGRLAQLAAEGGRDLPSVTREYEGYLRELDTRHDPLVHGLAVRAGRALCALGYSRIDCDPVQLTAMRDLLARTPAVVLSSHRSYLDGGALTVGFADHGLPPMAEFVGINLSFWPLGSLWRRMGGIFLRRASAGPIYRLALREALGRLVEQRRLMRWFIEGTRSRTGKLAPPRLGLLSYVVDAYLEGRVDDLCLVPVSVSYDQLHEVEEFAGEARGAAKQPETLGWLLRFIRAQRGRFGAIYVRFGQPVSLRESLGQPGDPAGIDGVARERMLNKLALEVSWQINAATPITGAALVAVALLAARGVPLTKDQIDVALAGYLAHARTLGLPLTPGAAVDDAGTLRRVLEAFEARGVLDRDTSGSGDRYRIAPAGHLQLAYYRNSLVHFFLTDAIAEVALLAAAAGGEGADAVRERALLIRDLLKFEFFFQEKEAFLEALEKALARLDAAWRGALREGRPGVEELLGRAPTLCSDMMLRAFLESYRVVADELVDSPGAVGRGDEPFLARCEARAARYLADGTLRHPESASRHLFDTGLKLAGHRRLLGADGTAAAGRAALAGELRGLLQHMAAVHRIAVRRVLEAVGSRPG
jgi:glycerol-3-phosphate O-acyltransferase